MDGAHFVAMHTVQRLPTPPNETPSLKIGHGGPNAKSATGVVLRLVKASNMML